MNDIILLPDEAIGVEDFTRSYARDRSGYIIDIELQDDEWVDCGVMSDAEIARDVMWLEKLVSFNNSFSKEAQRHLDYLT